MNAEKELEEIQRQFKMQSIIDAPGCILLGIGLYAKFKAKGDAFHPLLNDPSVVNSMLVVGGLIIGFSSIKLIALSRRQKELEQRSAM